MPDLNIDPEIITTFKIEADRQLNTITNHLLKLEKGEGTEEGLKETKGCLHTLKGDARMLGLKSISVAAHKLEDLFQEKIENSSTDISSRITFLFKVIDAIQAAVSVLPGELREIDLDHLEKETQPGPGQDKQTVRTAAPAAESREEEANLLTISIDKVDYLIKTSSAFPRFSNRFGFIQAMLNDLRNALVASVPIHVLIRQLDAILLDFSRQLSQYDLQAKQFQDDITKFKLVPLSSIFDLFPRLIRDIAEQTGKSVEFIVLGRDIELEKNVVESLKTILIHVLRNSVDHGCETPEERIKAGKPKTARVLLKAYNMGDNVMIEVGDDGKGIDPDKIRKRALELGLMSESEAMAVSQEDMINKIFEAGFTTKEIGDFSGRGVGLDYVSSIVKKLNGQLSLQTAVDKGTTFAFLLPIIGSYLPITIFSVKGVLYGVPSSSIVTVIQVSADQVLSLDGKRQFLAYKDLEISFIDLKPLFGMGSPAAGKNFNVMIARYKEEVVAMAVEEVVLEKKLLIRKPLAMNQGLGIIIGAVLLGKERAIPVLNIPALFDMLKSQRFDLTKLEDERRYSREILLKRVLLVEDSPVTRRQERQILDRMNLDVIEASNGKEALSRLAAGPFDLVITDIEMPIMNGFELVKIMKENPEYGKIPVVVVSSYDTYQDRIYGLGVDYFINKTNFSAGVLVNALKKLNVV